VTCRNNIVVIEMNQGWTSFGILPVVCLLDLLTLPALGPCHAGSAIITDSANRVHSTPSGTFALIQSRHVQRAALFSCSLSCAAAHNDAAHASQQRATGPCHPICQPTLAAHHG